MIPNNASSPTDTHRSGLTRFRSIDPFISGLPLFGGLLLWFGAPTVRGGGPYLLKYWSIAIDDDILPSRRQMFVSEADLKHRAQDLRHRIADTSGTPSRTVFFVQIFVIFTVSVRGVVERRSR